MRSIIIEYSICTAVSELTACARRISSAIACDYAQPRIFPSRITLPIVSVCFHCFSL
jgi:hypothetical protein